MTYEELLTTISEIINNKSIHKTGLSLKYELSEYNHKKMDEHLFIKTKSTGEFEHRDVIDIEIGGINITMVKKNNTDNQ